MNPVVNRFDALKNAPVESIRKAIDGKVEQLLSNCTLSELMAEYSLRMTKEDAAPTEDRRPTQQPQAQQPQPQQAQPTQPTQPTQPQPQSQPQQTQQPKKK